MIEEIRDVAERIRGRRILLQVPEGLKTELDDMVKMLEERGKEVVVCIDPSYGACDVRFKEMEASGCEAILHVGHAPMIRHPKVYYVEWRRDADAEKIREALEELAGRGRVCVVTSVNFRWVLEEARDIPGVVVGGKSWRVPYEGVVLGCDTSACEVDADLNAYIGDGYFHALAVWVNTGRPTFIVYPDGRVEEVNFERLVKRRLALIGSVHGNRVGIIVSSKVRQNRRGLAEELKKFAEEKGYEVNIYVSDYLDPLYLLGLPDDFFVFTGCPRVPIDDAERYGKPVLTPEEFLYKLGVLREYRIGWITSVPRGDSGE